MKRYIFVFAMIFAFANIFADYNRFNIPDSTQIRKNLVDTWFSAPLDSVRANKTEIHTNEIGRKFQVSFEENEKEFFIIVSPETQIELEIYTDTGVSTETQMAFPFDIKGSWVLVKDKKTEKPLRIRYYFSSDSDVFVQIIPDGKLTFADMVIFKNYVARGVQIGFPFETFYTASFEQFCTWTKFLLPWHYVTIHPDMYYSTTHMIDVIRANLSKIVYEEDAMYDENGKPIYISTGKTRRIDEKHKDCLTLSNAGFVKWIIDGLVYPLVGSYIYREPLFNPTVEYKTTGFQGIIDLTHDLSFSLNWTRNLALASLSVYKDRTYMYKDSGVDVNIEPFSATLVDGKILNTVSYIKDTGYSIHLLKSLLYLLAAENPMYCYLVAIRSKANTTPEVKPFNYCAAIFPYFDEAGCFCCSVFENGNELSLDEFLQKYFDDFVHLVRFETEYQFFPQTP